VHVNKYVGPAVSPGHNFLIISLWCGVGIQRPNQTRDAANISLLGLFGQGATEKPAAPPHGFLTCLYLLSPRVPEIMHACLSLLSCVSA